MQVLSFSRDHLLHEIPEMFTFCILCKVETTILVVRFGKDPSSRNPKLRHHTTCHTGDLLPPPPS